MPVQTRHQAYVAVQSAIPPLPREIWWLVSKEFLRRRDFDSLFTSSLVCRSLASIALPLLYSIHDLSPVSTGDTVVVETRKWALLWRSIIVSSLGETMHPYCLWIKSLNLGNLHSLLEDLARYRFRVGNVEVDYEHLKKWFFNPPMQEFYATHENKKLMDIEKIVIRVAEKVTAFLKRAADMEDKTVMLSSLEGYHLPTTSLADMVSRLSQLRSLTVRDGSVLTAKVSKAIRANCPSFREVMCHYCLGTDVDEELAGFFGGLAPNTLESFTIMSANALGEKTFCALNSHSGSLKTLNLCLDRSSLAALHHLSDCVNLEWLTLEARQEIASFDWENQHREEFQRVVSWLKECRSLTNIGLDFLPSAPVILNQLLRVPEIRLTSMDIKFLQADEEFYSSLGYQTSLQSLVLRTNDELVDIPGPRHEQFIQSICKCSGLRKLDLMSDQLTLEDVYKIAESIPELEDFSLDSELVDDNFLLPLSRMRHLKSLNINAPSNVSFKGLLQFFHNLQHDGSVHHNGIRIYFMGQYGVKFTNSEEALLGDLAARLGGRIDITYEADPDELHESDFSD
ncbi:hypothetical protein VTK73DRAFT_403 [Phialemonium thermophilum]|uniref:F-box domain-containing protein n=1 Tax=Phialemonium thermophilum TaxID=223376 RepID=A0ABR3XFB9_9PEZI